MKQLLLFLITLFNIQLSNATTFYLDPVNGDINNDGSINTPWPSLAEVVNANLIETREYLPLPYDQSTSILQSKNVGAPIQSGDTLMLMNGMHGAVEIDRHYNEERITIINFPDHEPSIAELHFRSSSNWNVVGLHISSEPYGYYTDAHLLYIESHGFRGPCSDFKIENCSVSAGLDGYNWTQEEWLDRTTNGIYVRGDYVEVVNNVVTNINHGIHLVGRNLSATYNDVINFSGDGIRPLGGEILVEYNLIKNCFKINDNHDDGIQSFNLNSEDYSNVIIRGNTILNYDNPNQPLLGSLQGIGCFDGPFTRWIVENNLISVDHWHGITFLGGYDCVVVNNTVIDPTPDITPGPSWIRIDDDKNGTPSEGCIVSNNLTNNIVADATISSNIEITTYSEYDEYFSDYSGQDFSLIKDCNAIDQADDLYATEIDILKVLRPQGQGADVGAYEYVFPLSTFDNNRSAYQVFPNPFNDILSIENDQEDISEVDISLIDLNGKKYYVTSIKHNNQLTIDTKSLIAGMYILQIKNVNYKVIKL